MLKYPLILIHGAGFRDNTVGIKYWGRIPRYLAKEGITSFPGGTDAWGSIESNANIIKKTILDVQAKTGAEKVNLLAHSRGGLEVRFVISALGMENAVASLTTVSTPHLGVKAMDIALKFPTWLYHVAAGAVDTVAELLGDHNPDFYRSSRQLSKTWCTQFNRDHGDREGVYYQSYASKLRFFFSDLSFFFIWILIRLFDGPNDGLCPEESAKWGKFCGTITGRRLLGVSHSGVLDLYRLPTRGARVIPPPGETQLDDLYSTPFNIPEFYLYVAKDLAKKGF